MCIYIYIHKIYIYIYIYISGDSLLFFGWWTLHVLGENANSRPWSLCRPRLWGGRARASRVTEVSKGGKAYKEKGEPIELVPDRLVVTAVDRVVCWHSLSLICSHHSRHFPTLPNLVTFSGLFHTVFISLLGSLPYFFHFRTLHSSLP